ncbi:MAG: hypothetical protein JWN40_5640 [Phycisphaerales bacterium]|nr:hypothetical protein [Phycisphaerales bacterium]
MKRDTFIVAALGVTLTGGIALAVPAPASHLAARQPSVRLLAEGKKEDKGEKFAPEKLP